MKRIIIFYFCLLPIFLCAQSTNSSPNENQNTNSQTSSSESTTPLVPGIDLQKSSKLKYSLNLSLKNKKMPKYRDTIFYKMTPLEKYNDSIQKQRSIFDNLFIGVKLSGYDFYTPEYVRQFGLSDALATNNINTNFLENYPIALGLNLVKKINNHIDFQGGIDLMFVKNRPFVQSSNSYPNASPRRFYGTLDFSILAKLLPNKYLVTPYIGGGVALSYYESGSWEPYFPVSLGLQFHVYKDVFINTSINNKIAVNNNAINHNVYTINMYAPINKVFLPKWKRIKNEKPKVGDKDKDGILDTADMCPTTPGLKRYKGCPIPDTDGDGINDEIDKCPTVKGLKKFRGCPPPDTDMDGIIDAEDSCPYQKGIARYFGCPPPDKDHDSVSDDDDLCPDVPGLKSNYGCPDYNLELLKIGNRFYFETAKFSLLAATKTKLINIIKKLEGIPNVSILLEGNTDTVGNYNYNLNLSYQRANSVKNFLTQKSKLSVKNIVVKGYSYTKPIASNLLKDGRALNRRVDLSIIIQGSTGAAPHPSIIQPSRELEQKPSLDIKDLNLPDPSLQNFPKSLGIKQQLIKPIGVKQSNLNNNSPQKIISNINPQDTNTNQNTINTINNQDSVNNQKTDTLKTNILKNDTLKSIKKIVPLKKIIIKKPF
ncbi:MAG: OmpA family protein [Alphaproteobacteria bacterium]|nr:OmpA family protein [Alphaproteobacteria bacterium]